MALAGLSHEQQTGATEAPWRACSEAESGVRVVGRSLVGLCCWNGLLVTHARRRRPCHALLLRRLGAI